MSAPRDLNPSELDVPTGWSCARPSRADVGALVELRRRHEAAAWGGFSGSPQEIEADVVGSGAGVRDHVLVLDAQGDVRAWGSVHDRAAGRVLADVTVDPRLDDPVADRLAATLFDWAHAHAVRIGSERGLAVNQLDSGAFDDDARQQRWLAAAGLQRVRSWWQMTRPVRPQDGDPGASPGPRDGVRVRLVARAGDGMPDEADLRTVHDVLEGAFADHFNSYAETFDEFVARLRSDPGHRWDHWWIAEITDEGDEPVPAGALVGSVSSGSDGEPDGSYVAYVGVLASARGRGVAKALLNTVIADAASRGRNRVGLEVDADSPTGAHRLYASMGFTPYVTTQSWHKDVPIPGGAQVQPRP